MYLKNHKENGVAGEDGGSGWMAGNGVREKLVAPEADYVRPYMP